MPKNNFRDEAHRLVDWMADYLENIESYPVKSQVKPGDIKAQLPNAIAAKVTGITDTPVKPSTSHETATQDIAIIGMAGRFPDANNLDEFWDNLIQGKDCIRFFTEEEVVRFKNKWWKLTLTRLKRSPRRKK